MRESTRPVVSITPTNSSPDYQGDTRYLRFYLIPEVMARLRLQQRDADKIYRIGLQARRLTYIPLDLNGYRAWCDGIPHRKLFALS